MLDRVEYLEATLRDLATSIANGSAGKIHAIKAWRAATLATLKDSKDHIEGIEMLAKAKIDGGVIGRIERLEAAVRELNPGLNI